MTSTRIVRAEILVVAVVLSIAYSAHAQGKAPASAPAAKVVGWRGDGTGKYPNATPPTEWTLNDKESKNIAWKTKLPCYSWSTPLIVGDKLFTRSDPYDLICMDKNSGKLLWIRSHPVFLALTAEEKKANPAWKEVDSLVADLQKVNDDFVKQGWTAELYKKKCDLQKQINKLTAAADKKYEIPPDKYVESWAGYTGTTPCCDGTFLYFNSGNGVTACYDLDGNVKWAQFEEPLLMSGEHGMSWSAGLVGDKLIVPRVVPPHDTYQLYARNKATGELAWKQTLDKARITYNVFAFNIGGVDYGHAFEYVFRASDGKLVRVPGSSDSGVADGNMLYFVNISGKVTWYKVEADLKATLLTPTDKQGYQQVFLPLAPGAKLYDPMSTAYVASPLYHDGLLYVLSSWGFLSVIDPARAEVVYTKVLPFDFKNPKSRKTFGMGLGASPALAGKYIYMLDSAGCMIVMEPGREYKQVAKNNIDFTVPADWETFHWNGPHHEQTEATPIFEGGRIYLRGEQFMYCVGEK